MIGKAEVDGDPVEWHGGIVNASRSKFNKKATYYSELVKGGEIHWRTLQQKVCTLWNIILSYSIVGGKVVMNLYVNCNLTLNEL